jgi:hypothetical protein
MRRIRIEMFEGRARRTALSGPPTVISPPVEQAVPADVRFAHNGLKSDIAPCPLYADSVEKAFFRVKNENFKDR